MQNVNSKKEITKCKFKHCTFLPHKFIFHFIIFLLFAIAFFIFKKNQHSKRRGGHRHSRFGFSRAALTTDAMFTIISTNRTHCQRKQGFTQPLTPTVKRCSALMLHSGLLGKQNPEEKICMHADLYV